MPKIFADLPASSISGALRGRIVLLEPLALSHEKDLRDVAFDAEIWRFLSSYGGSPETLRQYITNSLRDYSCGSALPFVVRAASNGSVVGLTRLKNISTDDRKATVGSWFSPAAWGTGSNTEAKLLLLEYAFESLHCIRIEFQTDSRNRRSRVALSKMGALEEGTLRSYQITADRHRRDTVVFSILDTEWPSVKQRLLRRLDKQAPQSSF